jgi:chemotaxis family two-component system response regulator Rcp1
METATKKIEILLIEDNPGDVRLIREAFKDSNVVGNFQVTGDGESAIEYLNKVGENGLNSRPDMIFLDLNLPKKNGLEVLEEVKSNPLLKSIPVVVLTTSNSEEHIHRSYRLNANCYIIKPVDFDQFTNVVKVIESFWFNIARLPSVN